MPIKLTLIESFDTPLNVPREKVHIEEIPDRKMYLSSNLAASSRLGNHLFELSALLSVSRKLNRIPTFFIQNRHYDQTLMDTDFLIPGLLDHFLIINQSIPDSITHVEFSMKCCTWDNPERLKNYTDQYLHIKGTHFQSWKYFRRMRHELMEYLKTPVNNFTDLPKSNDDNFVTCVHIRRTDFVGSGFFVPDETFILEAMKFVKIEEKRDQNMLTVLFGDDIPYIESLMNQTFTVDEGAEKNISSEFFISHNNPSDSILYSSSNCDVVIITAPHSTFGWWLGFLSKGGQVYYTDIKFVDDNSISSGMFDPDDYYPPHWIPIKQGSFDNRTLIESERFTSFPTKLITAGISSFVFHAFTSRSDLSFNHVFARIWQFTFGMIACLKIIKDNGDSGHGQEKVIFLDTSKSSKKLNWDNNLFKTYSNSILIVTIAITFYSTPINPLIARVIVTILTAVFIYASSNNVPVFNNLLIYTGNISFALYLVHWPLYAYWKIIGNDSHIGLFFTLIISIFIAIAFHETFEKWSLKLDWKRIILLIAFLGSFNFLALEKEEIEIIIRLQNAQKSTSFEVYNDVLNKTFTNYDQVEIQNRLWQKNDFVQLAIPNIGVWVGRNHRPVLYFSSLSECYETSLGLIRKWNIEVYDTG
ncbi:hypothetical protein GCK72_020484 [Caenorhabditis remanei]|uniref:L-Fucosyltransferase n=1 Tax=Caenorhabditis remanei TaxID=31234 RepID=A0A6A5GFB6_CAERE|nr:hypothetical protein GCK72_020484 [Caenorhabditis remanei]KAF1753927.1 hypothetical protein GCK72_020484 [Caenorhabditis remanei]